MAALDDGDHARLLRVAGGPSRPLLERSLRNLNALRAAGPGSPVRELTVFPEADGETGMARWSLEPRVEGSTAAGMTPALWEECLQFLVALHGCRPPSDGTGGLPGARVEAEAIGAHLDGDARRTLEHLVAIVEERLDGIPLGFMHGDFWHENLLVRDGSLNGVVDWDWSSPDGFPLLDLFDLIVLADPKTRWAPPGPRSTEGVLPLARAGGDEQVRRYCAETGTPGDSATLEGLAVAYWISRAARDLRPYTDRAQRPVWMTANVYEPLALLAGVRR